MNLWEETKTWGEYKVHTNRKPVSSFFLWGDSDHHFTWEDILFICQVIRNFFTKNILACHVVIKENVFFGKGPESVSLYSLWCWWIVIERTGLLPLLLIHPLRFSQPKNVESFFFSRRTGSWELFLGASLPKLYPPPGLSVLVHQRWTPASCGASPWTLQPHSGLPQQMSHAALFALLKGFRPAF